MNIKNLTMKSEYAYRIHHPKAVRNMRRKYNNSSLTKKLEWRANLKKMKEQQKKMPEVFNKDGTVDIHGICNRAARVNKEL